MSLCNYEYGVLYICALLMVPNLIFQWLPLRKGRHSAPIFTFTLSCLMNIGYGCLLYAWMCKSANDAIVVFGIVLVSVGAAFLLIPFDYCCPLNGNHSVFRQIFWAELSRDAFMRSVANNRASPPVVTVRCEAYHYETRVEHYTETVNGKTVHRTRTHEERVTTFRDFRNLEYVSWQEDGNSIRIGDCAIMTCVSKATFDLDKSAREAVQKLIDRMRHIGLQHDRYVDVNTDFSAEHLETLVSGFTSVKIKKYVRFIASGAGKLLWFIFAIIGYQSTFESLWCAESDKMVLKLRKKISMKEGLRSGYRQPDTYAVSTTFKEEALPS